MAVPRCGDRNVQNDKLLLMTIDGMATTTTATTATTCSYKLVDDDSIAAHC